MAEEEAGAASNLRIPRVRLGSQGLEVSLRACCSLSFNSPGITDREKLLQANQSIRGFQIGIWMCGHGTYNAPLSEEDGISIIKDAFSKGITFFDTANSYAKGANEILLGKALKRLPRQQIQLATKFGIVRMDSTIMEVKGTPEYVRECCEASLTRLDVDYIDLYYQHRVDTSVPIEETMGEIKKLVQEGKIKYVGLSEASPDTIKRAHAVHPVTAVQMEWSIWTRDIEEEIVPLCRELGIGIVAYSPLGHGFFGGKAIIESIPANTFLSAHPRFTGKNLEKNKILYKRIESLAERHECTPAQLALSWLHHQGDEVVPIPGTTKIRNLDENIGSLRVQLIEADLEEISQAVPLDAVAGSSTPKSISLFSWKFANTPLKDVVNTNL